MRNPSQRSTWHRGAAALRGRHDMGSMPLKGRDVVDVQGETGEAGIAVLRGEGMRGESSCAGSRRSGCQVADGAGGAEGPCLPAATDRDSYCGKRGHRQVLLGQPVPLQPPSLLVLLFRSPVLGACRLDVVSGELEANRGVRPEWCGASRRVCRLSKAHLSESTTPGRGRR